MMKLILGRILLLSLDLKVGAITDYIIKISISKSISSLIDVASNNLLIIPGLEYIKPRNDAILIDSPGHRSR